MSEPRADDLRRIRDAQVGDDGAAAPGCPPAEAWWDAWRGDITDADFARLVEHSAACAACARASRVAADLVRAFEPERFRGARRQGAAVWRQHVVWAAAAVLAVGFAGLTIRSYLQRPGAEVMRTQESAGPRSLLDESQPLSRQEATLRWTAGPAGSSYGVVVTDESLRPMASAQGLTVPEYRIPAEALAPLPKGARLAWQVETILPDGRRLPSLTFFASLE